MTKFDSWLLARLPRGLARLCAFLALQAAACLLALSFLAALIVTRAIWQPDWPIYRYDALVLIAVGLQALFIWTRLETWEEARVIALFHLTGTAMEWFKVSAGSWAYPEPGLLKLFDVPLFTGFMYASVGSYIARAIRLFDIRLAPAPPYWTIAVLAAAIYVNFWSHHFLPDARMVLFAATVLLFARTRLWFRTLDLWLWVPVPLVALGAAVLLWGAENIGTLTGTWRYAGQSAWQMVSLSKLGSWYLLLFVAFATVTLVARHALHPHPWRPSHEPAQPQDPQDKPGKDQQVEHHAADQT